MQYERLSVFICRVPEASVILAISEGPVCLIGCRFRCPGKGWGEARLSSYPPFALYGSPSGRNQLTCSFLGRGRRRRGFCRVSPLLLGGWVRCSSSVFRRFVLTLRIIPWDLWTCRVRSLRDVDQKRHHVRSAFHAADEPVAAQEMPERILLSAVRLGAHRRDQTALREDSKSGGRQYRKKCHLLGSTIP